MLYAISMRHGRVAIAVSCGRIQGWQDDLLHRCAFGAQRCRRIVAYSTSSNHSRPCDGRYTEGLTWETEQLGTLLDVAHLIAWAKSKGAVMHAVRFDGLAGRAPTQTGALVIYLEAMTQCRACTRFQVIQPCRILPRSAESSRRCASCITP